MNDVEEKIDMLIKRGILKKTDDIFIYGYNNYAVDMINRLYERGYIVKSVIDKVKRGKGIFDIELVAPVEALCPFNPKAKILIASNYFKEMKKAIINIDKRYSKSVIRVARIKSKRVNMKVEEAVYLRFPNIYHSYLNTLGFEFFKLANSDVAKCLKRNKKFYNIHLGERCFILGNGPSLDKVDVSLLKNEYIFGVNQITDSAVFDKLKINYWVCFDTAFLKVLDKESFETKFLNTESKLDACFFDIGFKDFIEKNNICEEQSMYYILNRIPYCRTNVKEKLFKKVSLDKFVLSPYTVVIESILIAIYMGFKEIYLLGCDETALLYIMNKLSEVADNTVEHHIKFKTNDISDEVVTNHMNSNGLTWEIEAEYIRQKQFSLISEYCAEHNIKLCNLTENTLIEGISRDLLTNIIRD